MEELSPAERNKLKRRDKKRITKMVVDNAGIKRILAQKQERLGKPGRSSRLGVLNAGCYVLA